MFANSVGNSLNANQILWQQRKAAQGKGIYPFPTAARKTDYHDYAVLVTPQATSFFLDVSRFTVTSTSPTERKAARQRTHAHVSRSITPDRGSIPRVSQRAIRGPQYFWAQWIRIYRPTSASC